MGIPTQMFSAPGFLCSTARLEFKSLDSETCLKVDGKPPLVLSKRLAAGAFTVLEPVWGTLTRVILEELPRYFWQSPPYVEFVL